MPDLIFGGKYYEERAIKFLLSPYKSSGRIQLHISILQYLPVSTKTCFSVSCTAACPILPEGLFQLECCNQKLIRQNIHNTAYNFTKKCLF